MIEAVLTSWMIFLCSLERLGGKDLTWDFESFMKSFSSFLRASSSTTLSRAGRIEQSKVRVCVCVCVCVHSHVYLRMCMHCIDQVSTTCQMSSQPQLQAQHNTCTVYSSIVSICKLQHQHIHTYMYVYVCTYVRLCVHTYSLVRLVGMDHTNSTRHLIYSNGSRLYTSYRI